MPISFESTHPHTHSYLATHTQIRSHSGSLLFNHSCPISLTLRSDHAQALIEGRVRKQMLIRKISASSFFLILACLLPHGGRTTPAAPLPVRPLAPLLGPRAARSHRRLEFVAADLLGDDRAIGRRLGALVPPDVRRLRLRRFRRPRSLPLPTHKGLAKHAGQRRGRP